MEKYKASNNAYLKMVVDMLSTGDWIENKINTLLRQHKLTIVQFNILRILQGASPTPISVSDINQRILFKKSDVTRLLDRLENKGLIVRKHCKTNRRKMDITISPKGLEFNKMILPLVEKELEGFFKDKVKTTDRDTVIKVLASIKS